VEIAAKIIQRRFHVSGIPETWEFVREVTGAGMQVVKFPAGKDFLKI
jgi:hypothetical protein